jgi:hypothetical protein
VGEPFELDLDQVAVTTSVEQVHQGTDGEATVGAKHNAVIRDVEIFNLHDFLPIKNPY